MSSYVEIHLESAMDLERIGLLFYAKGCYKIPTNMPQCAFYCHEENQGYIAFFIMDDRGGAEIPPGWHARMKEKAAAFLRGQGKTEIHMMTLVLCESAERAKRLCREDRFCWIIDTNLNRLVIYEDQVSDFYGWKTVLEEFMAQTSDEGEGRESVLRDKAETDRKKWSPEQTAGLPWVNIALVAANVIVFLICTFTGDLLYNKGALGITEIVEDGSYYRIITSMFLHSGVQHLFSNMIVLYYVGEIVEKKTGHILYGIIYFISGAAGAVFSMAYEFWAKDYYTSVGASGAVFGVEGALLMLVIIYQGKLENLTAGRLMFAIAFSLYCGFTGTNVNNAAHVGGVLMGFALMAVIVMLCPWIRAGKDKKTNED